MNLDRYRSVRHIRDEQRWRLIPLDIYVHPSVYQLNIQIHLGNRTGQNHSDTGAGSEECFIRGSSGRFRLDRLIPVAGNGVIVGTSGDGESLADLASDIDDLRKRINFE